MFTRYKKTGNASGKWQRVPHTGVGGLTREQIGDWVLEVAHRQGRCQCQTRPVQCNDSPRITSL